LIVRLLKFTVKSKKSHGTF